MNTITLEQLIRNKSTDIFIIILQSTKTVNFIA